MNISYSGGNTSPHGVSHPIPFSDTSHNQWTWRPFRRYICDLLVEIYPIYINYINYTHPSFCRLTSLAMGRPCHNRLSTRKRFRNKTKKCLSQKNSQLSIFRTWLTRRAGCTGCSQSSSPGSRLGFYLWSPIKYNSVLQPFKSWNSLMPSEADMLL